MSSVEVHRVDFWGEEPPLFGPPATIYPIMFPYLLLASSLFQICIAWAALFGHYRVRQMEIIFGPCQSEITDQELEREPLEAAVCQISRQ